MEIGRERSAPSLFVKRREVATLLHAGGGAPLLKDDLRPAQAPGVQGTPALVIGDTPQGLVAEAHGGRAR